MLYYLDLSSTQGLRIIKEHQVVNVEPQTLYTSVQWSVRFYLLYMKKDLVTPSCKPAECFLLFYRLFALLYRLRLKNRFVQLRHSFHQKTSLLMYGMSQILPLQKM